MPQIVADRPAYLQLYRLPESACGFRIDQVRADDLGESVRGEKLPALFDKGEHRIGAEIE